MLYARREKIHYRHDFERDANLSQKEIVSFINDHKQRVLPSLAENDLYYRNQNVQLTNVYIAREADSVRPNNYVPTSYPGYITRFFAGYIDAPGYTDYQNIGDNDDYFSAAQYLNRRNHEETHTNELGFEMHKHGYAWELIYLQQLGGSVIPRMVCIQCEEVIPIYDKKEHKELGAVIRIWSDYDIVTKDDTERVAIYYPDSIEYYIYNGNLIPDEGDQGQHIIANEFGVIPWIEYRNNRDYWPSWYIAKTEIDILDAVKTDTLNSLDRHARSVLLTSLKLSEDQKRSAHDWGIIDGMSEDDFMRYLDTNLDPDLREYMIKHFTDEIHKITGIPDITKEKIGADSQSGVARKMALYPLRIAVQEHVAYKKEAIERRIMLLSNALANFNIDGVANIGEINPWDIKISVKENLPADIEGIAKENQLLGNSVSNEWKVGRIPGADWEIEKERLEQEKEMVLFDIPEPDEQAIVEDNG
jgi:SPP1 family phage portal protein